MKRLLSTISLAVAAFTPLALLSAGAASQYTEPDTSPIAVTQAAEWSIPSIPQPPKPASRTIEIVNHLPSGWDVAGAVKFVDKYTASRARLVKKCSGKAYRCITIRTGDTPGLNLGWSSGKTITVDPRVLKYVSNTSTLRRWVVAHELGHQYGLSHSSSNNFMRQYKRGRPAFIATSAQKKFLANR